MEEDCQCPKAEPHSTKCEWYDPNIIYILETQGDISASEEAAQQKIYDLYLNSLNSTHQPTRILWLWNSSRDSLHGPSYWM